MVESPKCGKNPRLRGLRSSAPSPMSSKTSSSAVGFGLVDTYEGREDNAKRESNDGLEGSIGERAEMSYDRECVIY